MTDIEDDFDDESEPQDGDEDVDAESVARAVADSENIVDDPDIDTPVPPASSQLPDHVGSETPSMPTVEDILAGAAPVFLVHKSAQLWQRTPEALGVARRVTGGRIGLGTVIRLPRHSPTAAKLYLDACHHAALRIADPEVHAIPGTGSPAKSISPKFQAHYAWAGVMPAVTDPQAAREAWVNEVLESQSSAGANVLLSASGWVGAAQASQELQQAMSWVVLSRHVAGSSTPMFVNLTLAGDWIAMTALRQMLLHEIVESTETLWYIRVRWPKVDPRYGQLTNDALLDGYKELASTAALERKVLVLPNSGLTGWYSTALGASGFSTGTSWPEQAFCEDPVFGRPPGQKAPPPAERYFERAVLHPLLWSDAQSLASVAGHRACQCRYCLTMRANQYSREYSGAHYLVRGARLLDELGNSNRRLEALRIVQDAQAFVAGLAGTVHALPSKWVPQHLAMWRARLL